MGVKEFDQTLPLHCCLGICQKEQKILIVFLRVTPFLILLKFFCLTEKNSFYGLSLTTSFSINRSISQLPVFLGLLYKWFWVEQLLFEEVNGGPGSPHADLLNSNLLQARHLCLLISWSVLSLNTWLYCVTEYFWKEHVKKGTELCPLNSYNLTDFNTIVFSPVVYPYNLTNTLLPT